MKMTDRTGFRYGRLSVIGCAGRNSGNVLWKCVCDCGKEVVVRGGDLGKTKSCGCLKREASARNGRNNNTRNNATSSPLFNVWYKMVKRCHDEHDKSYKNYGARGITVCDRWRDDPWAFINDMGDRPENSSLDRIDNDKGYSPENCRWATSIQQSRNRRMKRLITAFGKTQRVTEWAEELRIPKGALSVRVNNGWSDEEALTLPFIGNQRLITAFGKTQNVVEWANETGLHRDVIRDRLDRGWEVERALTQKSRRKNK